MTFKGLVEDACRANAHIAFRDPAADGGTGIWALLSDSIAEAMPFQVTGEASDLLGDVLPSDMPMSDMADLILSSRPPAPVTWIEVPTIVGDEDPKPATMGLLIREVEGTRDLEFAHFVDYGRDGLTLPMTFSVFLGEERCFRVAEISPLMSDYFSRLEAEGVSREAATREVSDLMKIMGDQAILTARAAFGAFRLLHARSSPLEKRTTKGMSRQAFRALQRNDPEAAARIRDTIRIDLTQKGHQDLEVALARRGPGGGSPRRAHWVRGHLMWPADRSNGQVWRSAHPRGAGEPVMRGRVLTATAPDLNGF